MEDGSPLRVVEGGRAVEGAEEERGGEHARYSLQAEAPSQRPNATLIKVKDHSSYPQSEV